MKITLDIVMEFCLALRLKSGVQRFEGYLYPQTNGK